MLIILADTMQIVVFHHRVHVFFGNPAKDFLIIIESSGLHLSKPAIFPEERSLISGFTCNWNDNYKRHSFKQGHNTLISFSIPKGWFASSFS